MYWYDKRFHSLNYFLKETFGEKIIKIPLDGGFTCPNRDGTLSNRGCIFCSSRGSGDFAGNRLLPINEQFEEVRNSMKKKWPKAKYIPYFQAYTNTYAPVEVLKDKFYEALSLPDVVGISIATRPDCLSNDILSLLKDISKKTFLFVELGLQTTKESSIKLINRCYENNVFSKAVKDLKSINANVVCHCILGLPYETKDDMLNTVKFACQNNVNGIKLQLLHILKNTELNTLYKKEKFKVLTFEEYIDIVVSCLSIIPEDIVIHRLTAEGPRKDLVAPEFSIEKFKILNTIDNTLKSLDIYQGKNANTKVVNL